MKTRTVYFVEVCKKYTPRICAFTFFLTALLGYTGILPDVIGYFSLVFVVTPTFFLWMLTDTVAENFETLKEKDLILDEELGVLLKRPLNQSITFFPFIDVRLRNWRHKKLIKIHCDGHGELLKNPEWFNFQVEVFKNKTKLRNYKSYMTRMNALSRLIRRKAREEFKKEIDFSYEKFPV